MIHLVLRCKHTFYLMFCLNMDSEEIWTTALKAHGHGFCEADDTLKAMTGEMKPIKLQHKEHRDKMVQLMAAKNKRSARFGESRVRLHKRVQKAKAPSKDTIRDRCHTWDGERGEELYKMLTAPEAGGGEVKFSVRRSTVSEAEEADAKLERSLQADAIESDEEEEDDE